MERKANCWDVMGCNRGPGSLLDGGTSVCPAARETRLHGVHGGHNAGRACWVVAGTMCDGAVAGEFAKKYQDCQICPFYRQVKDEEQPAFKLALTLLAQMDPER